MILMPDFTLSEGLELGLYAELGEYDKLSCLETCGRLASVGILG